MITPEKEERAYCEKCHANFTHAAILESKHLQNGDCPICGGKVKRVRKFNIITKRV